MAELIVVGFEGTHRAAEVLGELEELTTSIAIDLRDAVAVYRTDDGRLRIDRSMYATPKEAAGWGGILGALVGLTLVAPMATLAAGPAAAAALGIGGAAIGGTGGAVLGADDIASEQEKYGISPQFVREVGGMVQPGQSAVFVLAHAADPTAVAERFRGYGGTILRTTLPPEQTRKIQETIGAARGTGAGLS